MLENQELHLNNFENLRIYIKKWTEKPIHHEDDIRALFINQLDKILIFHNLNSYYFINTLQKKATFDRILETATNADYYSILQTYQTQTKNTLIFQLFSIVERFFRVLISYFKSNTDSNKQFYKIKEDIFNLFTLTKNDEWNALLILSSIRNTFHNNGIHTSRNIASINYKGQSYSFSKNELHYNADYDTLFMITKDIVSLYNKICNSNLSINNNFIVG